MSRLTALAELRKQGALSEAEFEAKKARVLARSLRPP
ncbi:SHOCT domain-containing protein [Streptomyces sp. NP-1717]|nr:SHOCT domain-containing protein [Streptomyces sp. NP-1717]MCI3222005.1 SHOCT domain-containing protein [Streptomyces sp. NP-1717]